MRACPDQKASCVACVHGTHEQTRASAHVSVHTTQKLTHVHLPRPWRRSSRRRSTKLRPALSGRSCEGTHFPLRTLLLLHFSRSRGWCVGVGLSARAHARVYGQSEVQRERARERMCVCARAKKDSADLLGAPFTSCMLVEAKW